MVGVAQTQQEKWLVGKKEWLVGDTSLNSPAPEASEEFTEVENAVL